MLFAAVVTACGSDDEGGSDAADAQDPADLEGKAWVLSEMLDAEGNTQIVDVGWTPTSTGQR